MEIELKSLAETEALAAAIAGLAVTGDVVALHGDLGAGKTAFARAFIVARGGDEVPSPTFTLVQSYDLPGGCVYHFDFYRIETADEVVELGFEEALTDGISLIEWPEKMGGYLPAERLDVHLDHLGQGTMRQARLEGHGAWASRLGDLVIHV